MIFVQNLSLIMFLSLIIAINDKYYTISDHKSWITYIQAQKIIFTLMELLI